MILEDSPETHVHAHKVIRAGGVIAFRTDTFYGLGADPFNRSAIQRIKQLKGREDHKPILIVISNRSEVARFVDKPTKAFELLAEKFWPGPLTLVGKVRPDVPIELIAGSESIGVRLPDDDNVRALIKACGGALTATSANPSGLPPATSAPQVDAYFGGDLDLIVDSGEALTDQPSTVVDVSASEPRLIRAGVIAWSEIQNELSRKS